MFKGSIPRWERKLLPLILPVVYVIGAPIFWMIDMRAYFLNREARRKGIELELLLAERRVYRWLIVMRCGQLTRLDCIRGGFGRLEAWFRPSVEDVTAVLKLWQDQARHQVSARQMLLSKLSAGPTRVNVQGLHAGDERLRIDAAIAAGKRLIESETLRGIRSED